MNWNNGTRYPIQSGHGCFGCSEKNFWDNGPIYWQMANFPGFGIESNAYSAGTMVRLLEEIPRGRDPRDAWAFVGRMFV